MQPFYDKVSIGDVGFVLNGFFYRMFNVKLPWDDPLNQKISKDQPENYKAMDPLSTQHVSRKGTTTPPELSDTKTLDISRLKIPASKF